MLRGLFENFFRDLNFEEDGKYDWILRKIYLQKNLALEEEAERHRKAQDELIRKAMATNSKKNATQLRFQMIEDEKRQQEEQKKKQAEEDRQAAVIQKDLAEGMVKSTRLIASAEAERMRMEIREKVKSKLTDIMKQEEENANKRHYEFEGEIDEEFMLELQAAANGNEIV